MSWHRHFSCSKYSILALCAQIPDLGDFSAWRSALPAVLGCSDGYCEVTENFGIRMGSHLLPSEQGSHVHLPRRRHLDGLCHTRALGNERHSEYPALQDVGLRLSSLIFGRKECLSHNPGSQ